MSIALTAAAHDAYAGQVLPRPQPIGDQIVRVSNEWFGAFSRADADAFDRMVTDDFMCIQQQPNGVAVITKSDQMENLRKTPTGRAPIQRELRAVRVRAYGDVAILTAFATFRGRDPAGKEVVSLAVISEVWLQQSGHWRLTHFQITDVPGKPS